MKFPVKTTITLLVLGLAGTAVFVPLRGWWKARNKTEYRQVKVTRGDIVSVVNSTGTVQPVLRVQVGTFVSGPIVELKADFNQQVKKGQLLAKIDPRIYQARFDRDNAVLATRKAEVERCEALLEQAENDEKRAKALQAENKDYISDTEMDQFTYHTKSSVAQVALAEAGVKQAEAGLKDSEANLDYTNIVSPCDGVVIDRKIDEGQTLAASFQTPELFVVAPDMEKEMHVFASVDEADIGLIYQAQKQGQKVHFTVDAYPDDLFEGVIDEIRVNPTTTQNVVTYPVVVASPNPELKLLPGMTAHLSFQVDKREDVLKIPNAALRFFPKSEQVHPDHRKLVEGETEQRETEGADEDIGLRPAEETVKANKKRTQRHVWVLDGELLRAIEVTTGLSDYKFTELVDGDLKEGKKLVTEPKRPKS